MIAGGILLYSVFFLGVALICVAEVGIRLYQRLSGTERVVQGFNQFTSTTQDTADAARQLARSLEAARAAEWKEGAAQLLRGPLFGMKLKEAREWVGRVESSTNPANYPKDETGRQLYEEDVVRAVMKKMKGRKVK